MANTKVTGDLIAAGTITTSNIANSAVTTDILANSSVTAAKLNSITTDNISEGTNLFYTDARVGTYLSGNGYDTATNIIATITDSAPTTLDTLNELAAALGDDPNFATTVTNSIATKLPLTGGTISGNLVVSGGIIRASDGTAASPSLQPGVDADTGFFRPANNTIGFSTTGIERMRIDASGNVGIGTDSPGYSIDVHNATPGIELYETASGTATRFRVTVDSTGATYTTTFGSGGGKRHIWKGASTEVMRLDQNGYLGVGTSSPSNPLHIRNDSGAAQLKLDYAGSSSSIFGSSDLYLQPNGTTAMTLKSGGNVGIGTASPGAKLHILGSNPTINLESNDASVINGIDWLYSGIGKRAGISVNYNTGEFKYEVGVSSNTYYKTFYTNGSERMRIDASGNVSIGLVSGDVAQLKVKSTASAKAALFLDSSAITEDTYTTYAVGSSNGWEVGMKGSGSSYGYVFSYGDIGTASNERMRITNTGAVGINNTNPPAQLTISASNNFQTNGTLVNITDAIDTRIGFYHHHAGAGFNSAMELKYTARSQSSAFEFLRFASNAAIDNEFRFRGDGQAYADGSWNGGGADYAEYFETLSGSTIDRGISVVVDGDKVRPATESDDASKIIGIIRPKGDGIVSSAIGNTAWDRWNKKYLTDDFGEYIREEHNVIEWTEIIIDEEGNEKEEKRSYESHNIPANVLVPEDAVIKTHDESGNKFDHRKLNPDYDETLEYIPREQRDEWVIVGLLGQVPMLKGQPVNPNWIKMKDISETVELWFIK